MEKRKIVAACFLIALSYSTMSRDATAEVNTDSEKRNQTNAQLKERLDKKYNELNDAMNAYEKFSKEIEDVIHGLDFLNIYFSEFQSKLGATKLLLANVTEEIEKARNENKTLKELVEMDKSRSNELFGFMEEQKKWTTRIEAYAITLIASVTFAVVGFLLGRYIPWRSR